MDLFHAVKQYSFQIYFKAFLTTEIHLLWVRLLHIFPFWNMALKSHEALPTTDRLIFKTWCQDLCIHMAILCSFLNVECLMRAYCISWMGPLLCVRLLILLLSLFLIYAHFALPSLPKSIPQYLFNWNRNSLLISLHKT